MGTFTEHSRFQLEATKLGRSVVFQVTVFERKERGTPKLYAETHCYDALQYMIQFVVRDAATLDGVIERFVAQLLHRGFNPQSYRVKTEAGRWDEWTSLEQVVKATATQSA